jgi:hypothetical protein
MSSCWRITQDAAGGKRTRPHSDARCLASNPARRREASLAPCTLSRLASTSLMIRTLCAPQTYFRKSCAYRGGRRGRRVLAGGAGPGSRGDLPLAAATSKSRRRDSTGWRPVRRWS